MNEKNQTLNGIANRIKMAAGMVLRERLTCERARAILLKACVIQDTELAVFGLQIQEHGYELYQLWKNGEYVFEGSFTDCQGIAMGVIEKEGNQLLNNG